MFLKSPNDFIYICNLENKFSPPIFESPNVLLLFVIIIIQRYSPLSSYSLAHATPGKTTEMLLVCVKTMEENRTTRSVH